MLEEEKINSIPFTLLNGAALAYLGDAVYETAIRQHVIQQGFTQVNKLHKAAVKYVSAEGQARVIQKWIKSDDFLTEAEIAIYKRGRNHKANTKAKSASIGDYRQATGFEAILGWLHITNQEERIATLIKNAIDYIDHGSE